MRSLDSCSSLFQYMEKNFHILKCMQVFITFNLIIFQIFPVLVYFLCDLFFGSILILSVFDLDPSELASIRLRCNLTVQVNSWHKLSRIRSKTPWRSSKTCWCRHLAKLLYSIDLEGGTDSSSRIQNYNLNSQ